MSDSSSRWRIALSLAAGAWLVAIAILVFAVVRLGVAASGAGETLALSLACTAGLIALGSTYFAFRTLRRQQIAEDDLRRSQSTFRGILTIAADAIISVDGNQHIVHFNNGAETLFGYRAEEVLGQPLSILLPERYRRLHAQHVNEFGGGPNTSRRMGERRAIYGVRRDGSEFPAEASISRLDVEGTPLYSVVLRDISERLRTEERQRVIAQASTDLSASLEYEHVLLAAVHVAIPYLADCVVLDLVESSGEVRRVVSVHDDPERTRLLRTLAGRTPLPSNWPFPAASVLVSGERNLRTGLEPGWTHEAPDGVDPEPYELLGVRAFCCFPLGLRRRAFGVLTLVATEPSRVFSGNECEAAEELASHVAAAVDNAMVYRESRRASQVRDELLGVVSHDLRNPLSAISMCARVLADHPPEDPSARRDVASAILDSVGAMQRLIQDLLDAATIESGHLRITPELADMAKVAQRAAAMVLEPAVERGVELIVDTQPNLPQVAMDSLRIEQVLANLVGNAVKFTERGGRVSIEVATHPEGVRVAVRDTGFGIPAEALPHIFDRFWHARRSSRTAGTGLGLAIAKGILLAHGATLDVTSEVGRGSEFSFVLPLGDVASYQDSTPAFPQGVTV